MLFFFYDHEKNSAFFLSFVLFITDYVCLGRISNKFSMNRVFLLYEQNQTYKGTYDHSE